MNSRERDKFNTLLSSRLRLARNACGLSQVKVASMLGADQRLVGRWESGYSAPQLYHLARVARVYGVPVASLIPDVTEVSS